MKDWKEVKDDGNEELELLEEYKEGFNEGK